MNKNLLILVIVVIVIILVAIFLYNSINSNLGAAKKVASQFYSFVETNNTQGASTLYDSVISKPNNVQNMTLLIDAVNSNCGTIINYSFSDWGQVYKNGITEVNLYYNVTRTKSKIQEEVTLWKDNSTAPLRIAGYHVFSQCVLKP